MVGKLFLVEPLLPIRGFGAASHATRGSVSLSRLREPPS